jgi:hypothetical protein
MRKYRNTEWQTRNAFGIAHSWDTAQVDVLMDIRDELQKLNRVFECGNFLRIPYTLECIQKNTKKPKKRKRLAVTTSRRG